MKPIYEKISLFTIGLLYICAGVVILLWPNLLYYGVAAAFFIHGILALARIFLQNK
ncbi:MAG: hypothetical protein ACMXYF_04730 [Candidatus Woesearchaeota archaeon]